MSHPVAQALSQNIDKPGTTVAFVTAGFIPSWLDPTHVNLFLSSAYFLLIIPPAAWHLYVWIRKFFK